jgi:SAM-dependent methyltransferase
VGRGWHIALSRYSDGRSERARAGSVTLLAVTDDPRLRDPRGALTGEVSDREHWNAKHRDAEVGGRSTRAWLVEHRNLLAERESGRALDIACGVGREAVYLAELGFAVDAVDVSDVAIARLRERAAERTLNIETARMDLLQPGAEFPRPPYDVICCFYFLRRPLLASIAGALAPGGLLLFENFTRDHVEVVGGQMPERVLLDHNELLRAFPGLRVLRYREAIIGTERRRAVASLVARA